MSAVSDDPDDFPWSIGVFDAHCHPTDTMSTVPDISKMNAKSLTIMATRAQDQDLVRSVAADHGIPTQPSSIDWRGIVPSFGWHPWFSHQIYDDEELHQAEGGNNGSSGNGIHLSADAKIKHYQSCLDPTPGDHTFLQNLPEPRSITSFISSTQKRLQEYPLALIGEVGLDKAFRIPEAWLPEQADTRDDSLTPGGREGRRLSPYRVSLEHQKKVLLAQLRLAGRLRRAVSVHGVQAHGHLFETLHQTWQGHEAQVPSKKERKQKTRHVNKNDDGADSSMPNGRRTEEGLSEATDGSDPLPYPPRVCLHSYSGPPDTLKQYFHPSVPVQFFFSFSMVINFSTSAAGKTEQVIKAVPGDRVLIESDMHIAGEQMDENLKAIAKKVCDLKGWGLEEGVRQLGKNWKAFIFGGSPLGNEVTE